MPLASDDESESRAYVLSAVLSKDGKKIYTEFSG